MYQIKLTDGTIIMAELNASTWETDDDISEKMFTDENLTTILIKDIDSGETETLHNYRLSNLFEFNGRNAFCINPIPESEIEKNELNVTINDITDAVLELSELVYGGE